MIDEAKKQKKINLFGAIFGRVHSMKTIGFHSKTNEFPEHEQGVRWRYTVYLIVKFERKNPDVREDTFGHAILELVFGIRMLLLKTAFHGKN